MPADDSGILSCSTCQVAIPAGRGVAFGDKLLCRACFDALPKAGEAPLVAGSLFKIFPPVAPPPLPGICDCCGTDGRIQRCVFHLENWLLCTPCADRYGKPAEAWEVRRILSWIAIALAGFAWANAAVEKAEPFTALLILAFAIFLRPSGARPCPPQARPRGAYPPVGK